ncbi:serine/threonine-protein kinase [Sorangium cellulosum]|uniref:Protein kinase domain-containing protein n=1 Tax=Sorangium cellulosum So0157-2 TaxID=1254432 RepID=S4XW84_SORCE|nr:serine/threonine-protein kinase [Sorangium cellulosum]AGP34848.1 hypothetical protein SCE1572_10180 [Sorangium cellulosum So0157-2]
MSSPKSSTLLASGVLIDKKYRLVRQIGEGAMGVVWSAVNVATSREVALKLIHRPEAEFRLRLQREARNSGALRHRNVIDIYDMGETEAGEPFLVMQLLTGETVAELLARRRRLDPPVAASIGRDVARGLAAAHAMHIIHRDLKPANIFLHREPDMDEPVVKVLDFGVAKNLSVNDGLHTVQGGAVGSPLYMSPEQVRAEPNVDHRADIWALGVVLFEMLTGMRPFQGDAQAVFMGILTGEIPTVSRYLRRVDQGLVDLIARCMRRDRADRIASAAEVAAQLDRYAARGSDAGIDAALRPTSPEEQGLLPGEATDGGWQGAQAGAAQPGSVAQPGSAAQPGSVAQPRSVAQPGSVAQPRLATQPGLGGADAGAGALPLALLGGGPRAPIPVQEPPGAGAPPSQGRQAAAGQAAGLSPDAGQAGVASPRRAGSSGQHIAAASAGRALWEEDVATLPLGRGSAEAAGAGRQRAGSGQHPAAGHPAAALLTPLPTAASGPSHASAAQPAPAHPVPGAIPERGPWGMTVRMSSPSTPEGTAGPGGFGAAGAQASGSASASSSRIPASTVKLAPEPGASASDSRPGATTGTGVPQQGASSSTTPLVSNHPSVRQTGAHPAQGVQEQALQGDEQKRKRTAATLAIAAAALSLILVGMLIALRSQEPAPAAPAPSESAVLPEIASGRDEGTPPEGGGVRAPDDRPPEQPAGLPAGSATAPPPEPTAAQSAGPASSAGPAASGKAGPAAGTGAGTAASTGTAGAGSATRVGAGATGIGAGAAAGAAAPATPSSAKPRTGGSSPPTGTAQAAKPPSNPCAGLKFMEKQKCEARFKK